MVQGEKQDVFSRGQAQQAGTQQGRLCQVKGTTGFGRGQALHCLFPLRRWQAAQVDKRMDNA